MTIMTVYVVLSVGVSFFFAHVFSSYYWLLFGAGGGLHIIL